MEWDEAQKFPLDVIKQLGKIGILGIVFPEDLGGAGMGYVDYAWRWKSWPASIRRSR